MLRRRDRRLLRYAGLLPTVLFPVLRSIPKACPPPVDGAARPSGAGLDLLRFGRRTFFRVAVQQDFGLVVCFFLFVSPTSARRRYLCGPRGRSLPPSCSGHLRPSGGYSRHHAPAHRTPDALLEALPQDTKP